MPNRTGNSDNNRPNEGNQSSRHQHTKGAGSSFPSSEEKESQQQNVNQPQEYYPQFDETGKGCKSCQASKKRELKRLI